MVSILSACCLVPSGGAYLRGCVFVSTWHAMHMYMQTSTRTDAAVAEVLSKFLDACAFGSRGKLRNDCV